MWYYFGNLVQFFGGTTPPPAGCKEPVFLGLVPWYHYLSLDSTCNFPANFDVIASLPLILLALLDDMLRIAGIVAVGFVIYGGILYVVSQGDPQKTAQAQSTILNAIIGLAIALVAVGAVAFIGGKLGAA